MNTNLFLNENTNIKNDRCLYSIQLKENERMFSYNFLPPVLDTTKNSKNDYINSTNMKGVMQNNTFDHNGDNINNSTNLRNGIANECQAKKELPTRLFPGTPLMSTGQSVLKNTDLSSRLKYGEDTRTSKSANAIASYSADNFIPLVPAIAENVQNPNHIIPTNWVRGGMSSRSVIRNIDYLKSCGIRK